MDDIKYDVFDKCDMCGEYTNVARTYYTYDIHCDCCSDWGHIERVCYCENCVPSPPTKITVKMRPLEEL